MTIQFVPLDHLEAKDLVIVLQQLTAQNVKIIPFPPLAPSVRPAVV